MKYKAIIAAFFCVLGAGLCFSISLLGGITAPQIDTAYINVVVVTLEENGQPTAPFCAITALLWREMWRSPRCWGKP